MMSSTFVIFLGSVVLIWLGGRTLYMEKRLNEALDQIEALEEALLFTAERLSEYEPDTVCVFD